MISCLMKLVILKLQSEELKQGGHNSEISLLSIVIHKQR